ncbi:MAG TPA: hypothetical protein VMG09_14795 [Bacteroidota bacterium]|nr:hypothetical protein [Bacteroidota bacterium]
MRVSTGRNAWRAMLAIWAVAQLSSPLAAQVPNWKIIVHGNITTSSQIYPNVDATDPVERAQTYEVNSAFGYGGEVRYQFLSGIAAIGLSVDYLKATLSRPLSTDQIATIPVADGYTALPIEVTGYFIIPFSGKTFGVYMGAGGGMYIGERTLSIGNVSAASSSNPPGGGIHVLGGVSYSPVPALSILLEMKFRDVQFKATNRFTAASIVYNGRRIAVTQLNDARIYTDGVIFQLGIALSL